MRYPARFTGKEEKNERIKINDNRTAPTASDADASHNTCLTFYGEQQRPKSSTGDRAMAMLKIKPEISQKDLTYLLGMSKQSIAELLLKLEKNEFITRHPSENDKRVMIMRLTEKGEKAAGSFQ